MKLTWRVGEAPTGRYRSFHQRSWPSADYAGTDKPAAAISCEDGYTPARGRGDLPHAPLRVRIADHSVLTTDGRATFNWRLLKGEFATMGEAKAAAERALAAHPQFAPKM